MKRAFAFAALHRYLNGGATGLDGAIRIVIFSIAAGAGVNLITAVTLQWQLAIPLALTSVVASLSALLVARAGYARHALVLAVASVVLVCCYSAYAQDGIRNIALPMLPVVVVTASLLLDGGVLALITGFTSAAVTLMVVLRWTLGPFPVDRNEVGDVVIFVTTLILAAITGNMLSSRIRAGMTEQEIMREKMVQLQKMDSLGRLAGGVAHDFNNLLTVINGYAGMGMKRSEADSALRTYFSEIGKAGRHATELTHALLTFSRKQVSDTAACNWNELISESRAIIDHLLGATIEVHTVLEPRLGVVSANPSALRQVFMNLVVNARDAMPAGGSLTIRTSNLTIGDEGKPGDSIPNREYVSLSITDTGVGMDAEVRKHIFEPFYSTKDMGQGVGLGLSIVYGVVHQCGGEIIVESRPGQGASFNILIPRMEPAVKAEIESSDAAAGSAAGAETVLLVEDQDDIREFTTHMLEHHGYRVIAAASAGDALLIAEKHGEPIHVLLTDVVMPRMSGRELAKRIASLRRGIPVVFVSGYDETVALEAGSGERPNGLFLQKPFTEVQLLTMIQRALHQSRPAILVVDDDAEIRELLRQQLHEEGFQVICAADGTEVSGALAGYRCDLAVVDLSMPNRDGIETIQQLRSENAGIRIIAISGVFGNSMLSAAQTLGADFTLPKPVNFERLLGTIRELLARTAI